MSNRRVFMFQEVPLAFASATTLLRSVCGAQRTKLLDWLSDIPANPEEPVDIARFARVVTSDPTELDGASSGRTEEFQAKISFLKRLSPSLRMALMSFP